MRNLETNTLDRLIHLDDSEVRSSVIRQKGEFQNGGNKKKKLCKFSEKLTFLTPWHAHVRVYIRRCEMSVFQDIWRALFSCYLRFEIRSLFSFRRNEGQVLLVQTRPVKILF